MESTVCALILTFNEEIHLRRCLQNICQLTNYIIIVDSYSTDQTQAIAKEFNAFFFQHIFTNQANQVQWAIENCNIVADWIIRVDADEYLTLELIKEIKFKIPDLPLNITGITLKRRHYFLDTWIRYGSRYPLYILRIWRIGKAKMELKWMDEHIILLEGDSVIFENDFIDHNLNNLTWLIAKHNSYATREAIEQLNEEYNLSKIENFLDNKKIFKNITHRTRFFKNVIYSKKLLLIRSILYFLFRYFALLGFLDGKEGLIYHFLQGFWYRFLVDAKIIEIKHLSQKKGITIKQAIEEYSGYKIN